METLNFVEGLIAAGAAAIGAVMTTFLFLRRILPDSNQVAQLIMQLGAIEKELHGMRIDMREIGKAVTENRERIIHLEAKGSDA